MKLTLKHAIAAIILTLSLAVPVAAGPLEDAFVAYGKGDYATALPLFRSLADQGNATAQDTLGDMYAGGTGVPQSFAETAKWRRLAANQGLANAQFQLGFMYFIGQGVPQDYTETVKWYRLAADQGVPAAQIGLGAMYEYGRGVRQDNVLAHMWYNLCAAQGTLGQAAAVPLRDALATQMTPAQIAEAQKLASEWKPTKQPPR
jgi:uncharacterized protein